MQQIPTATTNTPTGIPITKPVGIIKDSLLPSGAGVGDWLKLSVGLGNRNGRCDRDADGDGDEEAITEGDSDTVQL
jgi:hypothetical protein